MLTAYRWAGFLIAGALAVTGVYLQGHTAGKNKVLAQWSASQVVTEQAVRQLEQSWRAKVDQQRNERDAKVQEVRDVATRVAANTDRLHLAAIKAERNACQLAASAPGRESPGSVLTDVLNRVGSRAGELAAYADELRAALNECRNSWPR